MSEKKLPGRLPEHNRETCLLCLFCGEAVAAIADNIDRQIMQHAPTRVAASHGDGEGK